MAIRRCNDRGEPSETVEILDDGAAKLLIQADEAVPANGVIPDTSLPDNLPPIGEGAEVHGLTDRDPDFFEKQADDQRQRDIAALGRDKMERGNRRRG